MERSVLLFLGCVTGLNLVVSNTAFGDDLDSKVRYQQQRTRWAIQEGRQKVEADRARMQSNSASHFGSASQNTSTVWSSSTNSSSVSPAVSTNRASTQGAVTSKGAAAGDGIARQAALSVFQQYKALDLSNSMRIMDLYADNAQIDVCGAKYTKTTYSAYVANAYNHPAGGLNMHTRYSDPLVLQANPDTAQVKFTGTLGPSAMTVYWWLRRNQSGAWQIASEQFVNGIH